MPFSRALYPFLVQFSYFIFFSACHDGVGFPSLNIKWTAKMENRACTMFQTLGEDGSYFGTTLEQPERRCECSKCSKTSFVFPSASVVRSWEGPIVIRDRLQIRQILIRSSLADVTRGPHSPFEFGPTLGFPVWRSGKRNLGDIS